MPLFPPIILGLGVSINLLSQIIRVGVLHSSAWGAVAIYSKNSYKRTEPQISCREFWESIFGTDIHICSRTLVEARGRVPVDPGRSIFDECGKRRGYEQTVSIWTRFFQENLKSAESPRCIVSVLIYP